MRPRARHCFGLVPEQCKSSLLVRQVEMEVLPACREYCVGVIPWSPLAGGVLAGKGRTASLRALALQLSSATLAELDQIFPGYQAVPEESAW